MLKRSAEQETTIHHLMDLERRHSTWMAGYATAFGAIHLRFPDLRLPIVEDSASPYYVKLLELERWLNA